MVNTESSWEIETLMRKAFARLKERFLTYVLAYILMVVLLTLLFILFVFIVTFAVIVFSFSVKFNVLIGLILAAIFGLCSAALLYAVSFSQLLVVYTLIREGKGTLMQNIRDVKGEVWDYVWYMVASSLFMIGLIPIGLLSLFIIFWIWMLWGYFATFVFLIHRKKGLDNLWTSYNMVNQRFWGIAGRMLIVTVGLGIFSYLLNFVYDPQNLNAADVILVLIQFIFGLFSGAFAMSYSYEIFTLLKVPTTVQRPKGWIVASIVGGVLMAFLVLASGNKIVEGGARVKDFFKDNYQQELDKNYNNEKNYQDELSPGVSNHVRYPRSS